VQTAFGTKYDSNTDPATKHEEATGTEDISIYDMWMDVHVMM
jgi:hypothetical protein